MLNKAPTIVLLVQLVLALTTVQARSQDSIESYRAMTRRAISDVRSALRPTLSEDERKIVDEINFVVTADNTFGGFASKADDKRVIAIYPGTAFLMNVLAQSIAVGFRGNVDCMQSHMFASIKAAFEGMDPRTPPGNRPTVWTIQGYSKIAKVCAGADQLIVGDDQIEQAIGATTYLGISLVILHEIAHQILGHVDETMSSPPTKSEKRRSRENEDEADQWALRKAIELKEPIILATPYILVMTATGLGDITLEGELSSTHPNGARRASKILDGLEGELNDLDAAPEMLDAVGVLRRQLDSVIPQ